MRLAKIQDFLNENGYTFKYTENDDCGGIEMVVRGLSYHIWEYPSPERGAASNVRSAGRMEDFEDNYEDEIINIIRSWNGQ